jgi:hypothetical protein
MAKRPHFLPLEVGQCMKARGDGVKDHAGNVINHMVFDLLQRWQIYLIIAPLNLVVMLLVPGCWLLLTTLQPATGNTQPITLI